MGKPHAVVQIKYADLKPLLDANIVFRDSIATRSDYALILQSGRKSGFTMTSSCMEDATLSATTYRCTTGGQCETTVSARGFINLLGNKPCKDLTIYLTPHSTFIACDEEEAVRVPVITCKKSIEMSLRSKWTEIPTEDIALLESAKMFYGNRPNQMPGVAFCRGYLVAGDPYKTLIAKLKNPLSNIFLPVTSLMIRELLGTDPLYVEKDLDYIAISSNYWKLIRRPTAAQMPYAAIEATRQWAPVCISISKNVLAQAIGSLDGSSMVTLQIDGRQLDIPETSVRCTIRNKNGGSAWIATKKSRLAKALLSMPGKKITIAYFPEQEAIIMAAPKHKVYCGIAIYPKCAMEEYKKRQ